MIHALLSPSSADRWIHCPPSAVLNAESGKDTIYTREGTIAHELAELTASNRVGRHVYPRLFNARRADIQAAFDALRAEIGGQGLDDFAAMASAADNYASVLRDIADSCPTFPHVALEQRVDLSDYVPDGYGTADCIMIGDGVLHVVDFKYGKGVRVSAEGNPQMLLYALGALAAYSSIYEIDTVRLYIVQPRLSAEPSTWETTADDLLQWAEYVVKPAAQSAAKGDGEYCEGDWCRWCAARGRCRAQTQSFMALEDFDYRIPPLLNNAEIGAALASGRRLAQWLDALEEHALGACLRGETIPGFKAVEGRATRMWTDVTAAFDAARAEGVPEVMLYERKPLTLAALEKTLGKKRFETMLGTYVQTPPGKPTLAPDTDRREAITRPTADDDFTQEIWEV